MTGTNLYSVRIKLFSHKKAAKTRGEKEKKEAFSASRDGIKNFFYFFGYTSRSHIHVVRFGFDRTGVLAEGELLGFWGMTWRSFLSVYPW